MAFRPRKPVHHRALKKDREAGRDQKRQAKSERRAQRKMDLCVGHESPIDPSAGLYTVDDPHDLAAEERDHPVEQFPNRFPEAPEAFHGIARTLSRGL